MHRGIQKSKIIISLCAILGVLSFQTAVLAKKKPKRKVPRKAAAKTVRTSVVIPSFVIKSVTTSKPNPALNEPVLKSRRAPVLSAPPPQPVASAGQLIISEFRLRGPNGAEDEFIEIYNASGADHTVDGSGTGTGYGIAASDGLLRCTIPDNTVIPNRGHYLCVNSDGYSLTSYPGGNNGSVVVTAIGDATYNTDIADNAGIALFSSNVPAEFAPATRLDSVGSTTEVNPLYKEGSGYTALTPLSTDYSFYRDNCGKGGSVTTFGQCPIGTPKDTDDNAADFILVDTHGTDFLTVASHLGAPGPENLFSPIQRNASFSAGLLDPCVPDESPPNRSRDLTMDIPNNSTFGTLEIRRTLTNNTGAAVTRLRFRIIDITTHPVTGDIADLRARSSLLVVVTVDLPPCGSGNSVLNVHGTTLEEADPPPPPVSQPMGGGLNSSLSAGTVTLNTPLANGVSINVRFLLGVQKTGRFKFYLNIEALP